MAETSRVAILIIDPQNDFHGGGSLAVTGADEDALRIAQMIKYNQDDIADIYITLDCHHKMHIAHKGFWRNENGEMPAPMTQITHAEVKAGKWRVAQPEHANWALEYTEKLEAGGRFTLIIWPEHCLIGTSGNIVVNCINDAAQEWALSKSTSVNYVQKGMNCLAEMYSVFKAEVPVPGAPETGLNTALIKQLHDGNYDKIVICGQAASHCVNYSTRDLVDNWKQDMSKLVLMEDGMSPVVAPAVGLDFTEAKDQFQNEMKEKGLLMSKCGEVMKPFPPPELKKKSYASS